MDTNVKRGEIYYADLSPVVGSEQGGVRPVLISECNNQNAANLLEHGIHAKWPDARVDIVPCSGLCSFYAQDQGVIITY